YKKESKTCIITETYDILLNTRDELFRLLSEYALKQNDCDIPAKKEDMNSMEKAKQLLCVFFPMYCSELHAA
ncbi:MAG: hypothetical protein SO101_05450, partial [Lachnospiraceae bacterium]|nr:hypothetical protein [Lachnospiraceae bacterium]